MEEKSEVLCKFSASYYPCEIQNRLKRPPSELECLACAVRYLADSVHPEDGIFQHVVTMFVKKSNGE